MTLQRNVTFGTNYDRFNSTLEHLLCRVCYLRVVPFFRLAYPKKEMEAKIKTKSNFSVFYHNYKLNSILLRRIIFYS